MQWSYLNENEEIAITMTIAKLALVIADDV